MIEKITKVTINSIELTPGADVGTDLSYGFKPSRAGWDKVGSYVNFGIESFVLSILPDNQAYETLYAIKAGDIVEVKINDETFSFLVSNSCIVTYPADVEVGVKYPQMKKFFRIDFMSQPA